MSITSEKFADGLVTLEQACAIRHVERFRQGCVVFTNGVFDILHRGHIQYLMEASKLGNRLMIGLNSDDSVRLIKGPDRPVNNEQDRAYALLALRCVDNVILFDEETPEKLIEALTPDVLVKGGDYKAETIVGYTHVKKHGGEVLTLPFAEGYSTTNLIERILKTN